MYWQYANAILEENFESEFLYLMACCAFLSAQLSSDTRVIFALLTSSSVSFDALLH